MPRAGALIEAAARNAVVTVAVDAANGVVKADVLVAVVVLSDEVVDDDKRLEVELLDEVLTDDVLVAVLVPLLLVVLAVLNELVVLALLVVEEALVVVELLLLFAVAVTVSVSALPVVASVSGPLTCWQRKARSPGIGGVTSTANFPGPAKPTGTVKARTP